MTTGAIEGQKHACISQAKNSNATARGERNPIADTHENLSPEGGSKCLKGLGVIVIVVFRRLKQRVKSRVDRALIGSIPFAYISRTNA